jgi:ADP-ribose pyrophosphatase
MSRGPDKPSPRDSDATVSSRRIYTGRVLSLDVDTVRFPNGSTGELEIIRHPGASAIVPMLDALDHPDPQVLLIRQYRYAAGGFLYEVPAGRLDAGEDPLECARRELREETGCTATAVERLGGFYTTPGFIDEFIHAFIATGLTRGRSMPERDEFISLQEVPLRTALDMVHRGEITDAKTIVSLFLADQRRRAPTSARTSGQA